VPAKERKKKNEKQKAAARTPCRRQKKIITRSVFLSEFE